jgi:hypothetical protein
MSTLILSRALMPCQARRRTIGGQTAMDIANRVD